MAAIAVAQVSTAVGSGGTASTSLAATLPSVTGGNTLFCFTNTSGATTTGVTGAGATWTLLYAPTGMGSPISVWAGTAYPTASGTQTITASYSASTYPSIQVIEVSGLGYGGSLLSSTDNIQGTASTTATSPTLTPSNTNTILLVWIAAGAAMSGTASSGWTALGADANYAVGGYITNPPSGSYTLTWTISSSATAQSVGLIYAGTPTYGGGGSSAVANQAVMRAAVR